MIHTNPGESLAAMRYRSVPFFSPIILLPCKYLKKKKRGWGKESNLSVMRHEQAKCQAIILMQALPGGNRNNNGNFNNLTNNANFWSSSEYSSSNAWNRNLNYNNDDVNRDNNNKTNGFSVRCVQD